MSASEDRPGGRPSAFRALSTAVLDRDGTVLRWSRAAAELLGRSSEEVCGRPVRDLLDDVPCEAREDTRLPGGIPETGETRLRHRSGRTIDVTFRVTPLEGASEFVVVAVPTRRLTDMEQGMSFLESLFSQDRIAVSIHDTDLRVVRANLASEVFGVRAGPSPDRLRDVMSAQDAEGVEASLREVLETGVPLVGKHQRMRSSQGAWQRRSLSLSAFRLEDATGSPNGAAAVFTDSTEQDRSRRHVELLHRAAKRIGASLDVLQTAQDVLDALVPALGDVGWVELADAVFDGEEPPKLFGAGRWHLRRAAVAADPGPWPAALLQPLASCPPLPDGLIMRDLQRGRTVTGGLAEYPMGHVPELAPLFVPEHGHSFVASPLFARGLVLGVVAIWRAEQPDPFDQEEADLLEEIATRAALAVDNARRYTHEHHAAVALQQRLLPRATTDTPATETAGLYRPAGGGAEISGDWFDVVPLPSLRTALVVGDVVGRGLHATAMMGRLRTAVRTLADLELDPDELLTHLDDLVRQLEDEAPPGHRDTIGGTCLYAVYDPVTRCCTLASAGHPPPVLVHPDGTTEVLELSPGPPLGVGGMPFEVTTVELEPGSVLALYTDGVIERADHDPARGLRRLVNALETFCRPDRPLDDLGRDLLADTSEAPPDDDIALLLARTRAIAPENTASWEFPTDPSEVATARETASRQLTAWGLDELAFTTELVVSELVTNAIRYAGGPVGLRLIRESVLVCEVSDPSSTQPRLRRARTTDEGGRGLFLVAQLTSRWGSRYGRRGKTIWTEQPLDTTADDLPELSPSALS
ncbi:SpoIIE family protein phosphatase [Streptomyces sp. NPDC014872]|uniref:SpoIIE family protein phosphatase n=1 Tax=Streptomyces sp. NPDC014872 TaxID=3364926 RepID=UPI0036F6CA64